LVWAASLPKPKQKAELGSLARIPQSHANSAGIAPLTAIRTGSGRPEKNRFFMRSGGFAAKTHEKDSRFHAAAGGTALMRPASTLTA
jgi:hypothetical protein